MCVVCIRSCCWSCFNVIAISIYMGFCIKLFVNANHTIIQSSIPSFELVIKTGNGDLPWNRYDFSHSHISFKFELSWLHTEMAQPQIVIYCFFSRSNHFQTTMNQCNECNACNACVTCECMYENLPQQEKKSWNVHDSRLIALPHLVCMCIWSCFHLLCSLSLSIQHNMVKSAKCMLSSSKLCAPIHVDKLSRTFYENEKPSVHVDGIFVCAFGSWTFVYISAVCVFGLPLELSCRNSEWELKLYIYSQRLNGRSVPFLFLASPFQPLVHSARSHCTVRVAGVFGPKTI